MKKKTGCKEITKEKAYRRGSWVFSATGGEWRRMSQLVTMSPTTFLNYGEVENGRERERGREWRSSITTTRRVFVVVVS